MIRVRIDPQTMTLHMDGHAGYAPEGQDIVCSAASMLAAALMEYVIRHADDDEIGEYELSPGHVQLDVRPTSADTARDCRCAFQMAAAGFDLLAARYPGHVIVD